MKKVSSLIVAASLLLVLIATSCGKAAPSAAQVLRVNLQAEPAQLDPNRASWAQERTIIMQVFEGLLGFNQDLSLKPVVARDIPTVANGGISADGKTYTFRLRTDATWSDGRKVTASDFEYSIKRMLSPELAADYAGFYFAIAGAEAYNGAAGKDATTLAQLRNAVGVKAADDATLRVTLAQPSPTFLQVMALWPAYPLRGDMITQFGEKWTEPPNYIGNGPFTMTEWVHQDHITLKANPRYWGAKPKLAEIQVKMITDANAGLAAFKNNELDIVAVPAGSEKATISDPVLGKQILRFPQLLTFGLRFNVVVPPFDNVKVRQAFSTAIDRDAFINNVRSGVGRPATSWIPPGMPGYDANLGSQYKFNAAKAKQLLADAGYADVKKLPPISFQYADSANNKIIAQFIQGQMKDNLGIDIALEPSEPKAFSQLVNQKKFKMSWFGWGADYPDPDNWLPEIFGTGAGNNKQNYSNPAFDALAKQAKSELDNAKRLKLWADAHKMVVDDAAAAFFFYVERFVLVKPGVNDLKTTGMDGAVAGDMFWPGVSIGK
ncbi:MAG: peptide ABC transporter substrate-binding protein [Chloroflexi bacterium]|nr:peptide ABC transporter substrate-binding protein [Chloroflexota bacterium]